MPCATICPSTSTILCFLVDFDFGLAIPDFKLWMRTRMDNLKSKVLTLTTSAETVACKKIYHCGFFFFIIPVASFPGLCDSPLQY